MRREVVLGDTVQVTGRVIATNSYSGSLTVETADERFFSVNIAQVDIVHPKQPPVGSAVVFEGVVWVCQDNLKTTWLSADNHTLAPWESISSGRVIFDRGNES